MADGSLTLTIVTPEAAVVERVSCSEVTLPTERGEIGILPGHTPLITLLGIGVVRWKGSAAGAVAVRDGFAEIADDNVRVLADRAAGRAMVDAAAATRQKQEAEERRLSVVGEEQLDAANDDAEYADARLKVAAG